MSEADTMIGLADEVRVAGLSDIPLGEGRAYEVDGRRVAVFRTRTGRVFATQAECPHKRGPLADGLVGGTTVVCPLHDRIFDLATGAAIVGECNIQVYPVRVAQDGAILLTLAHGGATASASAAAPWCSGRSSTRTSSSRTARGSGSSGSATSSAA